MDWNALTVKQKRHIIFHVLETNKLGFWFVCGKEAQKKYQALIYTEDNVDVVREEIYNLYVSCLNKPKIFGRKEKKETIGLYLGYIQQS